MEYVIMAGALAGIVLLVFILESVRAGKARKNYARSLEANYGKPPEREYNLERFARMGSYYKRHREEGQLDDITWNDLGMDDLFRRMNDTHSAAGEEYLYYALRTPRRDEGVLFHLEEAVNFFDGHVRERVQVQLVMSELGYTGKFSLYDYLDNLDFLGERSNGKNIVQDILFFPLIGMLWVNFSVGILGIVLLIIYNIMSYFSEKGKIDPYITSFSYIMRLMRTVEELEKISVPVCGEEWEKLRRYRKNMQGMKRNSYWVLSPFRGNSSGNVVELVLDYVRMVFHADLIKFNRMLKFLRGHVEDVDGMVTVVGWLDTAVAVGALRKSMDGGYCIPTFLRNEDGRGILLEKGYHPLLEKPVKNSIQSDGGVLLTGSNASGKSTFLKTVAINAVLAQTVHTCAADEYEAPFFYIYSSMALKDDLSGGESYYIVEVKALKRILDAAKSGNRPVLCFVDEVLRGTNTVERIAASTQILKSLSGKGILCFAATHDIELTQLLEGDFANYHFEEEVRDGDVTFNYRLQRGRATTRNAIRLLELIGYDSEIIERANDQAARFQSEGVWK